MKSRHALFALAVAALLSGCTSPGGHYQPLVPRADVGSPGGDWRPYVPPEPARPEDREWRPSNPDWGRDRRDAREPSVRREELAAPRGDQEVLRSVPQPAPAAPPVMGTFPRAEPRDPPSDLSTRRTYSSRPDRGHRPASDDSAFAKAPPRNAGQSAQPRGVRSEWADKAVRADNRPAFDRMVRESAGRGEGSFEDEAGRVYYGETVGNEDGCSIVEVTVTTSGGLPVVARGTAYDCR
ncbi:hypothetical protein HFO56_00955 [Rhizobium laguerreae]|uniref:hypothetical protein n=1 Tax=Rhizobium laguerreae TaxID=1076926 RepID=UPI001C91CC9A|nr:hypothetical protein [Rhizobium laguerreae]MBY3150999.1 hypothetical protein [Rhizobium laguerreae]